MTSPLQDYSLRRSSHRRFRLGKKDRCTSLPKQYPAVGYIGAHATWRLVAETTSPPFQEKHTAHCDAKTHSNMAVADCSGEYRRQRHKIELAGCRIEKRINKWYRIAVVLQFEFEAAAANEPVQSAVQEAPVARPRPQVLPGAQQLRQHHHPKTHAVRVHRGAPLRNLRADERRPLQERPHSAAEVRQVHQRTRAHSHGRKRLRSLREAILAINQVIIGRKAYAECRRQAHHPQDQEPRTVQLPEREEPQVVTVSAPIGRAVSAAAPSAACPNSSASFTNSS
ncbi:unnamed protein product [Sphagnum balticum]